MEGEVVFKVIFVVSALRDQMKLFPPIWYKNEKLPDTDFFFSFKFEREGEGLGKSTTCLVQLVGVREQLHHPKGRNFS